jgi:hypothetical protein
MNRRLEEALFRTHLSGLGLWWHLYPILQKGQPYGYTDMTAEEMALAFKRKVQRIRQGLWELRLSKVLIRNEDGTYTAPYMVDKRNNETLRAQIRGFMVRYRQVVVR